MTGHQGRSKSSLTGALQVTLYRPNDRCPVPQYIRSLFVCVCFTAAGYSFVIVDFSHVSRIDYTTIEVLLLLPTTLVVHVEQCVCVCPDDNVCTKRSFDLDIWHADSRSNSKTKVTGWSSRSRAGNVAKVVDATSRAFYLLLLLAALQFVDVAYCYRPSSVVCRSPCGATYVKFVCGLAVRIFLVSRKFELFEFFRVFVLFFRFCDSAWHRLQIVRNKL